MGYETELRFLQAVFQKCRVQVTVSDIEEVSVAQSKEKEHILGGTERVRSIYEFVAQPQSSTIYKVRDILGCGYIFLLLPDREKQKVLAIGPYLSLELNHEQIMEWAELMGIAPTGVQELERYYGSIPVLTEDSPLFAVLDTLGEQLWGGPDAFHFVNVEQEQSGEVSPLLKDAFSADPASAVWNMGLMEKRYEYENEIMYAVSQGQIHKAERLLTGFSTALFEQRVKDPVRNMKNYSIVMNTLLRKAAENGGVHPVYLDRVSSDFAKQIEALSTTKEASALMSEMFRSYCRLVRKHSIRQYSPPIQKVITYIDSDLTTDLSLSALARMQNVSAGYLSALFKQEMGQTLTEYVNRKRIKHAMQLLKTTQLQIQTIAQHCGILDVHYFSKMFKKYAGKTPKEYRESL